MKFQTTPAVNGLRLMFCAGLMAILAAGCGKSDKTCQEACPSGTTCVCTVFAHAPYPLVEEPCGAGVACPTGQTCEQGEVFTAGACSLDCSASASVCPAGASCINLPTGSSCLRNCEITAQCWTGFQCAKLSGNGDKVCVPDVVALPAAQTCPTPPTLVAGGMAGPASDPGCGNPNPIGVPAAELGATRVISLGVKKVGTKVPFTVPAGTLGFSVVSQLVSATAKVTYGGSPLDNTAVPTDLTDPSGRVLFDDVANTYSTLTPAQNLAFFAPTGAGGSTLSIPNTSPLITELDGRPLPTGTWSFVVNDYARECSLPALAKDCSDGDLNGRYDITVVFRTGTAATAGIDFNVYLVSDKLPTSDAAITDPNVQRMIQGVELLYGSVGVCLGTVTFYDTPDWAKAKYAGSINPYEGGACAPLTQMFTLSSSKLGINFFLVDEFVDKTGAPTLIVGIDGTIPGPPGIGGTTSSGAAVTTVDLGQTTGCGDTFNPAGNSTKKLPACGADFTAYIMAHEGGHWLGLFHTSESAGNSFDPLNDTPSCECSLCAPSSTRSACSAIKPSAEPTTVDASMCSRTHDLCAGADNLMFWLIDVDAKGYLTPDQGSVMAANPSVAR